MPYESSPELLVLHAVRLKGMASDGAVASRFALDRAAAEELLLDFEAYGWVRRAAFSGLEGWGVTESGRLEDNRRLGAELTDAGAQAVVAESHDAFARLNERFLSTISRWQLRPAPGDPMASNDHTDWSWDERVLADLAGLSRRLQPVGAELAAALTRFGGYPERLAAALQRVDQGERRWVDEPGIDSCHTVWFELHEDLLGTLGLERGADN